MLTARKGGIAPDENLHPSPESEGVIESLKGTFSKTHQAQTKIPALTQKIMVKPFVIRDAGDAHGPLGRRLSRRKSEVCYCLFLDGDSALLRYEEVSEGFAGYVTMLPEFRLGIADRQGCASLIIVRNHPSGLSLLSGQDRTATSKPVQVGEPVGGSGRRPHDLRRSVQFVQGIRSVQAYREGR